MQQRCLVSLGYLKTLEKEKKILVFPQLLMIVCENPLCKSRVKRTCARKILFSLFRLKCIFFPLGISFAPVFKKSKRNDITSLSKFSQWFEVEPTEKKEIVECYIVKYNAFQWLCSENVGWFPLGEGGWRYQG